MRQTIISCDNCDSIIHDKTLPGGTLGHDGETTEWNVWQEGKDGVDKVFCGIKCLKEWIDEYLNR